MLQSNAAAIMYFMGLFVFCVTKQPIAYPPPNSAYVVFHGYYIGFTTLGLSATEHQSAAVPAAQGPLSALGGVPLTSGSPSPKVHYPAARLPAAIQPIYASNNCSTTFPFLRSLSTYWCAATTSSIL